MEAFCDESITERAGRRLRRVVLARYLSVPYLSFPPGARTTGARIRAELRASALLCVTDGYDGPAAEALVVDELRDTGMAAVENQQMGTFGVERRESHRASYDVALPAGF